MRGKLVGWQKAAFRNESGTGVIDGYVYHVETQDGVKRVFGPVFSKDSLRVGARVYVHKASFCISSSFEEIGVLV